MPRETWLEALARARVVVAGPSRRRRYASCGCGSTCTCRRPTPGTRHSPLLDAHLPVAGLRVAVQEYGKPNVELVEGLEQRGATVTRVSVYRWALPEDLGPLRAAIVEIAQGRVGIALFTSAQQVEHLLQVAAERGSRGRAPHCVRDLHRSSGRSVRRPRKPSAHTTCRSISSRNTPSWATSSRPSPQAGAARARSCRAELLGSSTGGALGRRSPE